MTKIKPNNKTIKQAQLSYARFGIRSSLEEFTLLRRVFVINTLLSLFFGRKTLPSFSKFSFSACLCNQSSVSQEQLVQFSLFKSLNDSEYNQNHIGHNYKQLLQDFVFIQAVTVYIEDISVCQKQRILFFFALLLLFFLKKIALFYSSKKGFSALPNSS